MSNKARHLILLSIALSLSCMGCADATYSTWSFVKTKPETKAASPSGSTRAVNAYFADNFAAGVTKHTTMECAWWATRRSSAL